MSNQTCDIIFIMDQSGSMASIKQDAIGGYNTLLEQQKALPGQCAWTLVKFNDKVQIGSGSRQKIAEAQPLDELTYVPSGMTALYDAIGQTLSQARNWQMPDNPDHKVIVAIMTDGAENSSREYSLTRVRELTDELTARGWIFQYMGANQDAFSVAATMNIANQYTQNYTATGIGTRAAYGVSGQSMTSARGFDPTMVAKPDDATKPPPAANGTDPGR